MGIVTEEVYSQPESEECFKELFKIILIQTDSCQRRHNDT